MCPHELVHLFLPLKYTIMAQSHVLSQLKPMKQNKFTRSCKYVCLNELLSTFSNLKQSINLKQFNDNGHFGYLFLLTETLVEAFVLLTNLKICCNGK